MPNRIFVSSTFRDLEDHRRAVQGAIRQLDAVPVAMEDFGARDAYPLEECIRLVKDRSDLFVGVYAHRYGHIPEKNDMSISELEYRAASAAGLTRLIYLIDDEYPVPPASIEQGPGYAKLIAFKNELRGRHMCGSFTTPDNLAAKVAADIGRYMAVRATPLIAPRPPVRQVSLESAHVPFDVADSEWSVRRNAIYDSNRNIFLAHVLSPSSIRGQEFDVFIYLVRHPYHRYPDDFSDVHSAEFFLGKYWGNEVFSGERQDNIIGIATAAYGTFLCTCRITFTDGASADVHRYIDFEAARAGGA